MRGDSTLKPRTEKAKKCVLFVCIGNACRSQMAEAFARCYGSDILTVRSAGLAPAGSLPPLTRQVLTEKNVSAEGQFPKGLAAVAGEPFEVVVNLSGESLPATFAPARVIEWRVRDPIGQSESVYRDVAAQIEALVMRLILELRTS
jgi:arsenate reductase